MTRRTMGGAELWGPAYPVVRDFIAYGLGVAGPYQARECLNPDTRLERVDGVSPDDVTSMAALVEQTLGLSGQPLVSLTGRPLHVYLSVLARCLRDSGITLRQARLRLSRALPDDWRTAARAQAGASRRRPPTGLRPRRLRRAPAA